MIAKVLRDCFTGKDGATYDVVRVCGALCVLVFLLLTVYSVVVLGQCFDADKFGIGVGALFAALGWSLGRKAHTEPEPKP